MLVPWGLGQMEGGPGAPTGACSGATSADNIGTGCRQGDVCVFRKMRTLIGDALERVFENLALKYSWG